ncbi:MAG: FAD-dependent oxidoreductase [Clostridia bacterium]|nr:FAD-dependent oxidoreductase [Clostridia bacterium]
MQKFPHYDKMINDSYDIIIIGAGPAGLTAAIYARRANKSVLLLEKNSFGGQMTFSPKIENYPGFVSASGNELADTFVEQALAQGAQIELEEVLAVKKNGGAFEVETDSGVHAAKSVIIASGAKHRLLGVPHEEEYVGNGISFCAVCDGAFYAGKRVAVIGGGNSAMQEAILLAEQCESVTVIQNLDFLTGEKKLAETLLAKPNVNVIYGTVIKEFTGDGETLSGVVTKRESDGAEEALGFDGVFIAIGLAPDTAFAAGLAQLNDWGYIVSDENCKTGCPGLFVAGDCRTKAVRQVATAVADGASAALAAAAFVEGRWG